MAAIRREQRLLRMVPSLSGGQPVDLSAAVCIDRPTLALVLSPIAHTAGSHEHSDLVPEPNIGTVTLVQLGSR